MTAYAPDGTPVDAFAVLPAGPAPGLLAAVIPPGASVLDLGCGAGRIAHALADAGYEVTGVDQCQAMLDHVEGRIATHLADIEGLELGLRFEAVLLPSFLVNTADEMQRHAFLATCARHLSNAGSLYIQRLDAELVPIAVDAQSEDAGVMYAMSDVHHDGDRFEATMAFTAGDQRWEHRYAGVVLDDDQLAAALEPHALRITGFLDDQRTWVEARA